jgi:hypothetical protein
VIFLSGVVLKGGSGELINHGEPDFPNHGVPFRPQMVGPKHLLDQLMFTPKCGLEPRHGIKTTERIGDLGFNKHRNLLRTQFFWVPKFDLPTKPL